MPISSGQLTAHEVRFPPMADVQSVRLTKVGGAPVADASSDPGIRHSTHLTMRP